jgi:hypothetical protein
MVLQPANQTGVAVGAQNPANKRLSAVFVIDVWCFLGMEVFLADCALAALVGVDPVIVFRG